MRKLSGHMLAFVLAIFIVLALGAVVLNWMVMPRVTRQGQEIEVPDVAEQTVEEAENRLEKVGLQLVLEGAQNDPDVPPGHLVSQIPEAYSLVKKGRRIYAMVSKGGERHEMIEVSGGSVRQARLMLRQRGFEVGNVVETSSYTVPKGVVIAQKPRPGESVEQGTLVTLVVSAGKKRIEIVMPDLMGKGLEEAQQIVKEMGLRLLDVEQRTSVEMLPNTVLEQAPGAGEEVVEGERVRVVVSKLE
ncbi:MAG: PASTA domain-containing protein [Candidatus Latescibacteria bacterium]|nr:PASTA domain-containing protein [Candidatus Latescibacterota bacterium]